VRTSNLERKREMTKRRGESEDKEKRKKTDNAENEEIKEEENKTYKEINRKSRMRVQGWKGRETKKMRRKR
jgi:hypothetical protein